jgi:isopenicillin-N N-acyltransferase-like protein
MPTISVVTVSGSPQQMGQSFGEAFREEIAEFYELRLQNAIMQAKSYGGRDVQEHTLLGIARACVSPTESYDPDGFEELKGIAAGAALPLEKVLALNGLTDFRDILSWHGELEMFGGCSAFVAQGDMTRSGKLTCGQTWDLATDNMPYVLGVHRRPRNGPESWTLTTVGCLSLIGINEEGICMGTTNIRTVDARAGVVYLSIIHKALGCRDFEAAARCVSDAPRAGAHFYFLGDGRGSATTFECTAEIVERRDIVKGVYVHCNHCLEGANSEREGPQASDSSITRTSRLQGLLDSQREVLDIASLKGSLSDHDGADNAICRHDFNGISTNGAVVMSPEDGKIYACQGNPCSAVWIDLKIGA